MSICPFYAAVGIKFWVVFSSFQLLMRHVIVRKPVQLQLPFGVFVPTKIKVFSAM